MQTATILLALAGHVGNTIEKYEITPSEVMVLRGIHGEGAVTEIHLNEDEIERSDRAERVRLLERYAKMQNVNGQMVDTSPVSTLFPGAAARMFRTFDELDLPDSFYKSAPVRAAPAKRRRAKAAVKEDEDGIGEMDDAPAAKKPAGRARRTSALD